MPGELTPMNRTDTDLLIIGGGLVGAGLARAVRDADPGLRLAMIDAGPVIGTGPGRHLDDAGAEVWRRYRERAKTGSQPPYLAIGAGPSVGPTVAGAPGGMYSLAAFGEDAAEFPAAAVGWNSGGMGVHWSAATPAPYGQEVFGFIEPHEWAADLARARELLRVHPDPYGQNAASELVMARLREVFDLASDPGRQVQPMPMAVQPSDEEGRPLRRVGPSVIFPPIGDGSEPLFDLIGMTVCPRIVVDEGRAAGAVLRDLRTGEERYLTAAAVAVCADTMRTPQLLWASGVRPAALGRHLNEHVFISGRVLVSLDRVPIDLAALPLHAPGEWDATPLWLPHSGQRQPFQGQIMTAMLREDDSRTPYGYAAGLSFYVPTEVREENRVEFSSTETDPAGLPRMSVRFSYSDCDRAAIEAGRQAQRCAGEALGDFNRERDSAVLAPGSSLHYTGTVRMGPADDGTSVCDPDGRVWGTTNLFVAGNGVIPTPMTANTTLTGMITAVRAARAISRRLPG
ncbi:MAG: GMC oxidoreductase [Streptosporangiaceae bacterium]